MPINNAEGQFEPTRSYDHCPLKTACLPIPPLRLEVLLMRALTKSLINFASPGALLMSLSLGN